MEKTPASQGFGSSISVDDDYLAGPNEQIQQPSRSVSRLRGDTLGLQHK